MAKKHKGRPTRRSKARRRKKSGGLWFATVVVLAAAAAVLYFMMPGSLGTLGSDRSPGSKQTAPSAIPAQGNAVGDQQSTAVPQPTPEPTPAPTPVDLEHPYMLVVDRNAQVVTAYTLDEDGNYKLAARRMICSVGAAGALPADGTYKLDGEKKRWLTTVSKYGVYVQYATRIDGVSYFKSLPYADKEPNALMPDTYKSLGSNIPANGVWLTCADAKWIYDNVTPGTTVTFVTGSRDEALLAQLAPPELVGGNWDPTDPDARNTDYDANYEAARPQVTPWLGVTPRPTFDLSAPTPSPSPTGSAAPGETIAPDAPETPEEENGDTGASITQIGPTATISPYDYD